MEKNLIKRAYDAFYQGDYTTAKALYEKASEQYGESLFHLNIVLCDKYLQAADGEVFPKAQVCVESTEVKKLQEQIHDLQQQLREKDANINERFEELAILTRMLEEKDNAISA